MASNWFYDFQFECSHLLSLALNWFWEFKLKYWRKLVDLDHGLLHDLEVKCWRKLKKVDLSTADIGFGLILWFSVEMWSSAELVPNWFSGFQVEMVRKISWPLPRLITRFQDEMPKKIKERWLLNSLHWPRINFIIFNVVISWVDPPIVNFDPELISRFQVEMPREISWPTSRLISSFKIEMLRKINDV